MADYWAVAARHNVARPTEPGLVGDLEVMAAADAAFPGLPAGMTAGEETRRIRAALEAVAPRLRARWVAEALEQLAGEWAGAGVEQVTVADVRAVAAEYRDGQR